MANYVEKTAKTVQIAINEALEELGVTVDEVLIEVIDEGEEGKLLGIGRRPAKVRVSIDETTARETIDVPELEDTEEPVYYGDEAESEETETNQETEIVNYVAAVLSGIGIHGKISSYWDDETLRIEVTGDDIGAAIGRRGETLDAIQYMTSLVANRHSKERVRVVLDIGGYRYRHENNLISIAERAAESVAASGREYALEPMNPAERRIVHTALQNFSGVTTYSEGEGQDRHIIIAPDTKD